MSQVISAQGAVYSCLDRDDKKLVLLGLATKIEGRVCLNSPLPDRLRERLSGRCWRLAFVDCRQGLSVYTAG